MRPYLPPFAALVLLHCLATGLTAELQSVDAEPQTAIVTSPGAPVRSGPGDSYYLTDTLPEDTEVEVYKRQPDGWCAIRPPEGSFSWVFAQHVRMVTDDGSMNSNVAEISKDKVAARVGSRLSSQRDVVQVRMKKGERVAVLGRDDRDGGTWYKIAPPAGEFRWIQAREIGLGGKATAHEESNAVRTVALEEPVDGKPIGITAPPLSNFESTPAAPITNGAPIANTAPIANQEPIANKQWSPAKTTPPPADITPIAAAPASSAELAAHLQELELRLSRMVAESPATWNIAPLEQAAEQLLARSESVQDRQAVKSTLAKIDRFSSIQRRYVGTNPTVVAAAPLSAGNLSMGNQSPNAAMPGAIAPTAATPITGANANSPYDAVGTLRPVVSKRPGAPQFALVNAQGQVVTFITPTPDVNLQPFIGQQIGVTGSRGYIPEFRRAHVTASRVSPLNERMTR